MMAKAASCMLLLSAALTPISTRAFTHSTSCVAARRVGHCNGAPSKRPGFIGAAGRVPTVQWNSVGANEASSSEAAAATMPQSDATNAPSTNASATKKTFTSPTFQVYIEDTDAYGVVYNGNYLRFYERALSHVVRDEEREEGGKKNGGRWILSGIAEQRFRSSPALGEEYVVCGELLERCNDGGVDAEVWKLEMVTANNGEDGAGEIVHNSATVTLARATQPKATPEVVPFPTLASEEGASLGKMFEYPFIPYHDEFDTHHHPSSHANQHIPLRNAMNFFERTRSTYLGGPDALRRMQVEDDLLWVVTAVAEGELFHEAVVVEGDGLNGAEEGGGSTLVDAFADLHPAPGKEVMVQTEYVAKRRGMIIDCLHRLYVDIDSDNGEVAGRRLLAKATVTVMALKGSTRRPTSKLPQWVLDRIA